MLTCFAASGANTTAVDDCYFFLFFVLQGSGTQRDLVTGAVCAGVAYFFPQDTTPGVFLTLCAGGKYTSKFRMPPELWQSGLTEKTPKPTRQVV
jgi:hypothetical protein